jgi:hypothetical protein
LVAFCITAIRGEFFQHPGNFPLVAMGIAPTKSLPAKSKLAAMPGFNLDFAAGARHAVSREESSRNPWENLLPRITNEEDGVGREKAIDSLIQGLDPSELSSAIRFFSERESNGRASGVAGRLIRHLAEIDPALAAGEVEMLPESAEREKAMQDVAIAWASRNADDAAKWVRRWPDGDAREHGMIGVAYEAARHSPLGAMAMAAERAPSPARDDLISHVAAQWAATDPQAASEWVKKIPDAALRARVAGTIAAEWAERDPVAAAAMAVSRLPAGRLQDDAVIGIVERWVQIDPDAAQSWVQQFPNGALRQTAMDNLAKLWPDQTP